MDLFDDLPLHPGAMTQQPVAPGAQLLRGLARESETALLLALEAVIARAALRHMQTPGGY